MNNNLVTLANNIIIDRMTSEESKIEEEKKNIIIRELQKVNNPKTGSLFTLEEAEEIAPFCDLFGNSEGVYGDVFFGDGPQTIYSINFDEEKYNASKVPEVKTLVENIFRSEFPRNDKDFIIQELQKLTKEDGTLYSLEEAIDMADFCEVRGGHAEDDGYDNPISYVNIVFDENSYNNSKVSVKEKVKTLGENIFRSEFPRDDKDFIIQELQKLTKEDGSLYSLEEATDMADFCEVRGGHAEDDGYDNPISYVNIVFDEDSYNNSKVSVKEKVKTMDEVGNIDEPNDLEESSQNEVDDSSDIEEEKVSTEDDSWNINGASVSNDNNSSDFSFDSDVLSEEDAKTIIDEAFDNVQEDEDSLTDSDVQNVIDDALEGVSNEDDHVDNVPEQEEPSEEIHSEPRSNDVNLNWYFMADKLNQLTIAQLSDEGKEYYNSIMNEKVSRFNANEDTIKLSDKMKALNAQNKINKSKKYGIDKVFASIGNFAKKVGTGFVHIKNKIVNKFVGADELEESVWNAYRKSIQELDDEELEWMYNNMNNLQIQNANFSDIQATILVSELNKRKTQQMEPLRQEYYELYTNLLGIARNFYDNEHVDVTTFSKDLLRLNELQNKLNEFYSVSLDRSGDVKGDIISKMSKQGQHYAAKNQIDYELQHKLNDSRSKAMSAAKNGNNKEALLYFLKHESLADQSEDMKKTILGTKFNGGLYHERGVDTLNHEKDNHWSNIIKASLITLNGLAIAKTVSMKIQDYIAFKNINFEANNIKGGLEGARQGYYDAIDSSVASSSEIAGQSVAAGKDGMGGILSISGNNYSVADAHFHEVNDIIHKSINNLKSITNEADFSNGLATLNSSCKDGFQAIIDGLKSTATGSNNFEIARLDKFQQMVDSMPTVENYFVDSANSLEKITELSNYAMTFGNDANTANMILRLLPDAVQGATLLGIVAMNKKNKDINISDTFDQELHSILDDVDQEELDEYIENRR